MSRGQNAEASAGTGRHRHGTRFPVLVQPFFTSLVPSLSQSGKPLFGIQDSNAGKGVIFGGGIPVVRNGNVIGAVGASAGTVEQDIEVAEAAVAALEASTW